MIGVMLSDPERAAVQALQRERTLTPCRARLGRNGVVIRRGLGSASDPDRGAPEVPSCYRSRRAQGLPAGGNCQPALRAAWSAARHRSASLGHGRARCILEPGSDLDCGPTRHGTRRAWHPALDPPSARVPWPEGTSWRRTVRTPRYTHTRDPQAGRPGGCRACQFGKTPAPGRYLITLYE